MVEICDICNETFNSPEDLKRHDDEDHRLTNNIEVISDEYKISEYPEEREMTKSVWTKGETSGYQGMTIKGGSVAYKDACTALKTQFVKGKVFKDLHGRQLKIIEVSRNKPIEVEVTTLSKKTNERKGKAQIHMWEPTKKKPCTIMVSLHSGSQFVFVKAVMEKFIKPFIDALISEPDEDPLSLYRMTNQDKPVLKENMSVKFDN